jgi:hypothetical protein
MKKMKTSIMIIIMSLIFYSGNSQTSDLPLYHPDIGFMQQMLQNKSDMYQGGFQSVSTAYKFLMNLQLFNKENIRILEIYKESVNKNVEKMKTVDFSIPSNVDIAVKFIDQYYTDNQYIRDEMKLLNKLFTEIDNLKVIYPANFTSTDRYKELIGIVTGDELKNCSPDQIKNIGLRHGLI